ncbi:MAG: helix-turn-helix transcriptional regulator [Eubacteriales bacterium]|nr:helix-turn-helix transcriptional regulator [Eubacteriales bacterium]
MDKKCIGSRIRYAREKRGFSRDLFAESVGISSKFLYEIEAGRKGFSAEVLLNLARALSVSCDFIMFGKRDLSNTERVYSIIEQFNGGEIEKLAVVMMVGGENIY